VTNEPNVHPDALLAEYAEDALGPEDRARVDAHLSGCERCGREVAVARQARAALADLPELDAPRGLGLAVRREARSGARGSRAWRVVAPVAAAAVLVAGGIVVVRSLSNGGDEAPTAVSGQDGGAEGAPAAPEAASPDAADAGDARTLTDQVFPRYSESPADYTRAGLVALARSLRDEARSELGRGLAPSATAFFADFDPSRLPPQLRPIYRCVVAEVAPDQLIVPFTIVAAAFEGEPAYVASFLQGPAPDQAYDRVVIWVVGREDCRLRSLASQRL
jgi:hypothetical protein